MGDAAQPEEEAAPRKSRLLRRTGGGALKIAARPSPGDDFDFWMLLEPCSDCFGFAARQHIHWAMTLEIAEQDSIALAPAPGLVVNARYTQRM